MSFENGVRPTAGTLRIESDAPATSVEWDRQLEACDYATFFHSRAWAEAWRDHMNGRLELRPRLLAFSDGSTAVLPLTESVEYRGLIRTSLSSVGFTYGGWLAAEPLSDAHRVLLEDYILRARDLYWRINPFVGLLSEGARARSVADDTHALRLNGDVDDVRRGMSKGHRAALKQAERAGVTVRCATERADWEQYYAVYRDSIRRWGSRTGSIYPFGLFEILSKLDDGPVRLWLALHDGRIVAGALCLYTRDHVAYWHGAALEAAFPVRPVHYLIYDAIRDAIDRGCRWFDFNPSGSNPGVADFKRHFGAVALPSPVVTARSTLARVVYNADSPRRRRARRQSLSAT